MNLLEKIFIYLTEILSKNGYLALTGSFLWGILSVVLSPCHLGSIPLIVAFVSGQGRTPVKRAFLISLLFSSGILISISLIGLITGLAGSILGNIGIIGNIIVAVIFIITGLYFTGLIRLPDLFNIKQPEIKKKGLLTGFMLGLLSGLALGPCTFAFMAPVLAVSFSNSGSNLIFSILLLTAFALGHSLVFVFFGTFAGLVQKILNLNEKIKVFAVFKIILGIVLMLIGIYLIFTMIKSYFTF